MEGSNPTGTREKPRFAVGAVIRHKFLGRGRIAGYDGEFYVVHLKGETKRIPFVYQDMELETSADDVELARIKEAVSQVLGDHGWIDIELDLLPRWVGGTMRLLPGREDTQPKDIPLEAFFKKLIGVREKLRVLEQKINNHPKLEMEERFELQSYITRCYGSLTTFNVLFSEKYGQFKGSSGTKDDE